jgi:nucleotide-binding universal stress UspA family protein
MQPFRKILVAVDFSPTSEQAVAVAGDLARRYGASVTLVTVYEPIAYALPDGGVLFARPEIDVLFEELEKQLEGLRPQSVAADVGVELRVLQGVAASEICAAAEAGGFDLIVMGTHGRTGVSRFLLGSVAERVVRTAPCAVLTVRLPSASRAA